MRYTFNNINTKQYHEILKYGEDIKPEQLISALTGKDTMDLTLEEIDELNIGDLSPRFNPLTAKVFVMDGVLYGIQPLDKMSFGLFADLLDLGKDFKKFLPVIMAYLYRPVLRIPWLHRKKLEFISKYARYFNNKYFVKWMEDTMINLKYDIEKYDPTICEERMKIFEKAPATCAHFAIDFFLELSQKPQSSSQRFLTKKEIKEIKKTVKEKLTYI